MQKCRNCGKQGNSFAQFGTKHYYCSKECYEASYKLVKTTKELYDACQSWNKDIVVEGDLAAHIITLKEVPEAIFKACTKLLSLFGFKNLEKPYEGDFNAAATIIRKGLENKNYQDLFRFTGLTLDPVTLDLLYKIIVAILITGVAVYAIYSRYEIEVEYDPVTERTRVRLVPTDKK